MLFGMLGYDTESLGQGHGRVPDGIAISSEFRYAIIYDAKIREQGYNIGTDDRTIREYINNHSQRLRHDGIQTIYFSIISSFFTGDNNRQIPAIKVDTHVNEVNLIEINALLAMLESKLRNPSINLGPYGIQRLLASSGVLSETSVREFLET
ncbi:MAG: restriction endonuclease FokI C-terminal domain-containing protein [Anaerolineaceae bacterium]